MTTINDIVLVPDTTEQQRELLVRYAARPRSIRPFEWREALSVFDNMSGSMLSFGERRYTLSAFYDEFVENRYADSFLQELIALKDTEVEGFRLLESYSNKLLVELEQAGVQLTGNVEERCLIAFCHYWWTSFCKGYIREVAIFRDLEASGISFEAHNLMDKRQRFKPFDLKVSGWRGDIKTSTYFLHVRRSFPLTNDFYIVVLYDEATRQKLNIVMMKPAFWEKINGETISCELRQVSQHFPKPVQITAHGENLVVVPYSTWKQLIRRIQQREEVSR